MIPGVPYDAEIEYLESTGTQWIDTGVKTSTQGKFELTVSSTKDTSSTDTWGASGSSSTTNCLYSIRFMPSANSVRIYYDANHFKSYTINYLEKHTYAIDQKTGVCIVDGISSTFTPIASTSFYGLFLFATSNLGTVGSKCKGKCYSAKIYDNSVLVRDFIPVRVGQTGYMYDRVTKRLFGNKGTGSFVLGPDVAKPVMGLWRMRKVYTADDYIKDGLVAMWDGIENAGWGVHDFTATVWKDLVGGISPTCSGSPTWTSDAYDFNASTYFTSSSTLPASIILSGNYTLEIALSSKSSGSGNGGIIGIGTSNRTFWIWERSPSYSYLIDTIQTAQGNWNRSTNWGLNKQYVFQFSVSPTGAFFDVNGSRFQTKASTSTASQSAGGFYLGRIHGYSVCRSAVHCYRLYNRALSAAEIAHNYAIDKARFNLP